MDELLFNGKLYKRRNRHKWTYNNEVVPETTQRQLNAAWESREDWTTWSQERLTNEGRKCKESGDITRAIRYFELLITRDPEGPDVKSVLASLSSCYRDSRINQPERCIELFERYKIYGNRFMSSAFLTSIAAAYLDINDLFSAKAAADRACALNGGRQDFNLAAVYQRLHAAGL